VEEELELGALIEELRAFLGPVLHVAREIPPEKSPRRKSPKEWSLGEWPAGGPWTGW
jgi:hypothetical protein